MFDELTTLPNLGFFTAYVYAVSGRLKLLGLLVESLVFKKLAEPRFVAVLFTSNWLQ